MNELLFGDAMQDEMITGKVIGCAYSVYNAMGFGFQESVYEKCMQIELEKSGLRAAFQHPIEVFYENHSVGEFIADILVEDRVIVELKAVNNLVLAHEVQVVNYLVATGKDIGLLINFGPNKVDVKRKYRKYQHKR